MGLDRLFCWGFGFLAWKGLESVVPPSASLRPSAEWNAAFAAVFRREAEASLYLAAKARTKAKAKTKAKRSS
jgi:hypothetical protein